MLYFINDYSEGAHEKILQHLIDTNMEQLAGYGMDHYCEAAKEKIKKACGCEDAEVFLLTGGTQTNQIVIDTLLQPYEGVVAAQTGHVSTHEAGAIEFTGHKVLELPQKDGKICAADLQKLAERFYGDENHEHMVFPGMVYISHPTEYGTLYSRKELEELSAVCREYKMPLYLDGARLIYGIAAAETDVTLQDIAELCDVFYIGGTKAGALCGEAVVFTGDSMPKHFLTRVKQHGALLAKGRLVGVQFDALFTDELYKEIDPSRLTTLASCDDPKFYQNCSDLMAWNKYIGWYGSRNAPETAGNFFDKAKAASDGKPVAISEYGGGANVEHHFSMKENDVKPSGQFHPEEGQTYIHEGNWSAFAQRPYMWAKYIWVFADFQSSIRNEGGKPGINDKGLVTYDRKIKKDAFYFYKASWSTEPMIYITSRRFTERPEANVQVKVYSNLRENTLYVNGKKIGKQKSDSLHRVVWQNVTLSKGENRIRVEGKSKAGVIEDTCVWYLK